MWWKPRIFFLILTLLLLAGYSHTYLDRYKTKALLRKITAAHGGSASFYRMRNVCLEIQTGAQPTKRYFFNFHQEPTELLEKRNYYLFALPFKLHDAENSFTRLLDKTIFDKIYLGLELNSIGATHELYIDPQTYLIRFLKVERDPTVKHEGPLWIEFKYETISGQKLATQRWIYQGTQLLQYEKITNVIFWCRSP